MARSIWLTVASSLQTADDGEGGRGVAVCLRAAGHLSASLNLPSRSISCALPTYRAVTSSSVMQVTASCRADMSDDGGRNRTETSDTNLVDLLPASRCRVHGDGVLDVTSFHKELLCHLQVNRKHGFSVNAASSHLRSLFF